MSDGNNFTHDYDYAVDVETKEQVDHPKMYRVVLHNDDYTTMEFVIEIIVNIFHKSKEQATQIMLDVHKKGKGIVGTYSYDIAVTKANQVHQEAKKNEFPLKCTVETA